MNRASELRYSMVESEDRAVGEQVLCWKNQSLEFHNTDIFELSFCTVFSKLGSVLDSLYGLKGDEL